jgi:hypothetical protein
LANILDVDGFEDLSFLMADGETTVRVDVPRELLFAIARAERQSPERYRAVFEQHRASLERLASAKYDAGHYQRYANSCVVPIRTTDWAGRR